MLWPCVNCLMRPRISVRPSVSPLRQSMKSLSRHLSAGIIEQTKSLIRRDVVRWWCGRTVIVQLLSLNDLYLGTRITEVVWNSRHTAKGQEENDLGEKRGHMTHIRSLSLLTSALWRQCPITTWIGRNFPLSPSTLSTFSSFPKFFYLHSFVHFLTTYFAHHVRNSLLSLIWIE